LLQHFLHFSEAEYLGNQFFDQLGVAFTEPVEQALGFLPGQQFVGVQTDHFGEVGGEDRSLVDDGIAGGQRLRFQGPVNPKRGDAERGLAVGVPASGAG